MNEQGNNYSQMPNSPKCKTTQSKLCV